MNGRIRAEIQAEKILIAIDGRAAYPGLRAESHRCRSRSRTMKPVHVLLTTIAALGMGPRAVAQVAAPKPEAHLAFVEIGQVFTKYEKAINFKAEMTRVLQPFKDQSEDIKAEVAKAVEVLKAGKLDPIDRVKLEQNLAAAKRKLEELDREARAKVGDRQQEHVVKLFKEINAAIKEYADRHGILIVLSHGEPPAGDLFTYLNVNRKLTALDAGGTVPLYVHASVNITEQVVDALNRAFRKEQGAKAKANVRGDDRSRKR